MVLDIERNRVGQKALEELGGLVGRIERLEPRLLGNPEILAKAFDLVGGLAARRTAPAPATSHAAVVIAEIRP
jgi:hypothetical protein